MKICFAHFGGEKQWIRYLEQDRQNYSQMLKRYPHDGILFRKTKGIVEKYDIDGNAEHKDLLRWNRYDSIWHDADWHSIILSLILQYDNVYTDISYIIAKEKIYPLLKETLSISNISSDEINSKKKIRKRILFGTDYYVVRNHKSDKSLFANIRTLLSKEEFDLIARDNPAEYLENLIHNEPNNEE